MEKQVSNLVSVFMTKRILAFVLVCFTFSIAANAQDLPIGNGKKYTLGEINLAVPTLLEVYDINQDLDSAFD